MPPVHDEIGGIGHVRPRTAQRFDVAITQRRTHPLVANKRRIPHHEIRLRPRRLARVHVALQRHALAVVRHVLAGDGRGLHAHAVPATDRHAAFVEHVLHAVVGQHRIAVLDVAEVADHRLRRVDVAAGAVVPLQVADPQHHFGDGGGARVQLDAEQLVRVDGFAAERVGALAIQRQAGLAVAEFVQRVEHFAFEALQVFQRDVEEVAAAAGRVEHLDRAQAVVECAQGLHRLVGLAFGGEGERGGMGVAPFAAQRLDHGGQHQPLDVGARGVVRAELVPLAGVERAFEQGAEDGRLDVFPLGLGRLDQQRDLLAGERQRVGLLEQLAVEVQHLAGDGAAEAALVHVVPEQAEHAHGGVGLVGVFQQQVAEAVARQQLHVFGEHGEQAAHQELRDRLGAVAGRFQATRQGGEPRGNLAGDAGGFATGVERERVGPDRAQARADLFLAQLVERDAVAARVGERRVGGAGAAELRIQLDAVAHVHHQQERRAALAGRQRAGVLLGLAACAQHRVVEALGVGGCLELLRFEHEAAALVQVDASGRAAAVAVTEGDRPLEHVLLLGIRVRRFHVEQPAQVQREALRGGQLRGGDAAPFGDEGVGGFHAGGRHECFTATASRCSTIIPFDSPAAEDIRFHALPSLRRLRRRVQKLRPNPTAACRSRPRAWPARSCVWPVRRCRRTGCSSGR